MTEKCVYLHYFPPWNVFYVGLGSLKRAYSRRNRNKKWNNLVNILGKYSVFIFESGLTFEQASEIEIKLIESIGKNKLTNISLGGRASALGMRHSAEFKQRISMNNPNKRPENRAKLSEMMKGCGNPMFGRNHSEETKQKIRLARTGSKATEETKEKMSLSHKRKR